MVPGSRLATRQPGSEKHKHETTCYRNRKSLNAHYFAYTDTSLLPAQFIAIVRFQCQMVFSLMVLTF